MVIKAEYIWIDGTEPTARLRSKTKILDGRQGSERSAHLGLRRIEHESGAGSNSDCVLKPVFSCPDPIRGGDDLLVMTEVLLTDMTPHATNTRALLEPVAEKFAAQEPLFGIEQEYTFFKGGRPHGFPPGGGFPAPQGFYYCGVGADEVYGRDGRRGAPRRVPRGRPRRSRASTPRSCPASGSSRSGRSSPLDVSDQLWVARWLLYRIAEDFGVARDARPEAGQGRLERRRRAHELLDEVRCARGTTRSSPRAKRFGRRPPSTSRTTAPRSRPGSPVCTRPHRGTSSATASRTAARRCVSRGRSRSTEGLHRGPASERQHGPVRRDAPHHRHGAAARLPVESDTDKREARPTRGRAQRHGKRLGWRIPRAMSEARSRTRGSRWSTCGSATCRV